MPTILKLLLSLVLLNYCIFVSAEIYKWTDKNGKVHYSDKPRDSESKTIKVKDSLTQEQQNEAKQKARKMIELQNRRLNNQFETERDIAKEEKKKLKEQQELTAACNDAKNSLRILNMQRPVYQEDKENKRVFLTDEQRRKEIEELNSAIKEHCGN